MDQVDLSLLAIVITLGSLFGVEMSEIYDKNALGDEGLSGHKLLSSFVIRNESEKLRINLFRLMIDYSLSQNIVILESKLNILS